eukprot:11063556-Lingulodinium_polyedra.AAC.1
MVVEQPYVGHGHLRDAFYHFALPGALRPYFGLAPARAADAGVAALNSRPIAGHQWVWSRLA